MLFKRESSIFTWLYRIATNEAINFLKKQKPIVSFDNNIDSAYLNNNSYSNFDSEEMTSKLLKFISLLPRKQRIIFNMRYFDDIKFAIILQKIKSKKTLQTN